LKHYEKEEADAARSINKFLKSDYKRLQQLWNQQFPGDLPSNLGRHIGFGMDNDYRDILNHDLNEIENKAEEKLRKVAGQQGKLGFEYLLHPVVAGSCYDLYRNGHYRDAVLNSVIATFDHIRQLTGLEEDGDALVGKAFSLTNPFIVLSELRTESGQSDQKGFMQIFKGMFQGIRNPKAHSLRHDLTAEKAAQYLIFASLLVRRLDEAQLPKKEKLRSRTKTGHT
jgi:uncharacterized protein (TIGR02391 family)